jgi:T5SS/PEP-CTERM-associated repeat protein
MLLISAGLALGASGAHAQTLTWNNAAGGSAATAANWNPSQIPTAANDLLFGLTGSYGVTWNAAVASSRSHTYRRGTVTNTFSAAHSTSTGITIGDVSGDNATVSLVTGAWTSVASVDIGNASGSTGRLNVTDDDADFLITGATSDLGVGVNGAGTLSITGGGLVQVADSLIAGNNATSVSSVTVDGTTPLLPLVRSTLRILGETTSSRIGQGGDATMSVTDGALAQFAGDVIVANGSASTSSVGVSGTGGILQAHATLDVAGDLLLGANQSAAAAGTGSCAVADEGIVQVGGTLQVGGDPQGGTGALTINAGGTVDTVNLLIGANGTLSHNTGTLRINGGTFTGHADPLVVTGTGEPTLQLSSKLVKTITPAGAVALIVGNDAGAGAFAGRLLIDSGADLEISGNSKDITIADDAGTTGEITVTGPGSRLFATQPGDDIRVGFSGDGTLNILDGGGVLARNLLVPALPAGAGRVNINNAALFTTNISIGNDSGGAGRVEIGPGGNLTAVDTGIGILVRATGRLVIVNGGEAETNGTILLDGGSLEPHGDVHADFLDVDAGTVIAGSSSGDPRVLARTRVRAGGLIDVSFDNLVIGDPDSDDGFLADDESLVQVLNARTLTLLDRNLARVDTVVLDNGHIFAPNGLEIFTPDSNGRLDGSGSITAPQVFFTSGGSVITATGPGIVINGQLNNDSGFCDGTRFTFNANPDGAPHAGWTGAGAINARVVFNNATEVFATANMNLGLPVADGVTFNEGSALHANSRIVTLIDSNGLALPSVTDMDAGRVECAFPLTVPAGRRLSGRGLVQSPGVTINGILSPGELLNRPVPETGQLEFSGALIMNPGAQFDVELGGFLVPVQFDRVVVAGAATLAGTINLSLLNSFNPPHGSRFRIMEYASVSGQFTAQHLPPGWLIIVGPQVLEAVRGCPADFNHDSSVNSQDFFDFLTAFFAVVHEADSPADFNLDGQVNSQDFFDFLTAFFGGC